MGRTVKKTCLAPAYSVAGRIPVLALLIVACLSGGMNSRACASSFSLTGDLTAPNDVELFSFTKTFTDSGTTLRSLGYAGGISALPTVVPSGGFDTEFWLFAGTEGILIDSNDDGGANVNADPVNGLRLDSFLFDALPPGSFTLALTAFGNSPVSQYLSDGFDNNAASPSNQGRTLHWAVDIINVDSVSVASISPTPLPASLPIFAAGLFCVAGFVGVCKKRKQPAPTAAA